MKLRFEFVKKRRGGSVAPGLKGPQLTTASPEPFGYGLFRLFWMIPQILEKDVKLSRAIKRLIAKGQLSYWGAPTVTTAKTHRDAHDSYNQPQGSNEAQEGTVMEEQVNCPRCGDALHHESYYRCFNCQYEERS